MSVMGCITLFNSLIMIFGLIYGWLLLYWPSGFVFWRLHRLRSPWVGRWIMHNGVILYRYNYSEIDNVFFLGGN